MEEAPQAKSFSWECAGALGAPHLEQLHEEVVAGTACVCKGTHCPKAVVSGAPGEVWRAPLAGRASSGHRLGRAVTASGVL